MFCEECGQKIDDDAKVCPYCGMSVYDEPGGDVGDKDPEAEGGKSDPEADGRKSEPETDGETKEVDVDINDKESDVDNKKKSARKKKPKVALICTLVILLIVVSFGGLFFFFRPGKTIGLSTSKAQQQVLEKVQATIEYNENADEMEYERTVVNCIMEQISVKTISDSDVEAVLEIKYPDAAALLRELIENNADCANKSELYQLMRDELNNGKAEIVKTRVTVEYDDSESIVMDEELVNILSGGLYTVDSEMEEQP